MRALKYIVYALMLWLACQMHAQAPAGNNMLFSSFFAEKNLSSPNITCFFQDSRGYMWIGTQDGLNYFNGKTIKTFKHDYLDKNSLPDNLILTICEDKQGHIWLGTAIGISRLDPELFTFKNYNRDSRNNFLPYKVSTYVDKENNVWAHSNGCLYRLNAGTGQFEYKKFSTKAGETLTPPNLYTGIFEDSQKRYWVTCNNNLYRYYPDKNYFEQFSEKGRHVFFEHIGEDAQGHLFCGSWDNGLFMIDAAGHALKPIEKDGLYVGYAVQQLNGQALLWYGGLSTYNLNNGDIKRYHHDAANPYSLRNEEVSTLFVDRQNQLWIGFSGKGIQIVTPANQAFKTVSIAEKPGMFPVVTCFIKTKQYSYAGGWHNYTLAKLDSNYKVIKTWRSLIPTVDPNQNNISDAWADGKGNIWFASAFGLIRFNEATEKTQLFKMDSSLAKHSHFLRIQAQGDSVLWLAGYFSGLSRFSLNSKKFRNWGAKERALYWNVDMDDNGKIWLANNSGMLTYFDPGTESFSSHRFDSLINGAICGDVLFDSIGNALWMATENGLLRIDRKTFAARLFTERDNLPTCQINSLQFDAQHRLWIATNKGLCFYDQKQNVFKTFFSNNGLPGNSLNQVFKLNANGELVIGYRDGFSILQTNTVKFEPSASRSVMIEKVYEANNIVPITIDKQQKTIHLRHDQDNLRIEFSFNDLINSEDNQLLFRLEGFDNNWYTAQNGVVNYSKLAPGKYLFHVSGIDHSGLKAAQEDYLAIIIDPPFWKTTWFIALCVLCALALTLLVGRYVFTRNLREKILILEKEQAIERERSRISQDMHDELGSGLTKISIMSEVAMTQMAQPDKTKQQLENISSSSRELVDNLQDIIWILNSKNDSLENLCAYIQEYALKYFEPFAMQVQVHFPEKISTRHLSEDQRRNILLVFKESFHNISKHSSGNQVTVSLQEQGNSIGFNIADNGRGFDPKGIRSFANGLHNMKKRMEHINGIFTIHSAPGQGTTSSFAFTA